MEPEGTKVPTAEDYLKRAREHYSQGDFRKALHYFEKACLGCPCNKAARLHRRSHMLECKRQGKEPEPMRHSIDRLTQLCETLASDDPPSVSQVLRTAGARCTCSSCPRPCLKDCHVAALDGTAASFEAQADFVKAFRAGLLLVRMACSKAEGYLRTAKVLPKLGAHIEYDSQRGLGISVDVAQSEIYKRGLANVAARSPAGPKIKLLKGLLGLVSRSDPIRRLPGEVVLMIFQRLALRDLVVSQLVSKEWRSFLTSHAATVLWQDLEFRHYMKPSKKSLAKVLQLSRRKCDNGKGALTVMPTTKRVVVHDSNRFHLTPDRLMVLLELPRLEHLEVRAPQGSDMQWSFPDVLSLARRLPRHKMPFLRTLILENFAPCKFFTWPDIFRSYDQLEHLELIEPSIQDWGARLERLRSLRLAPGRFEGSVRNDGRVFTISGLSAALPRLEQLYIDVCTLERHGRDPGVLSNLKCLALGPDVRLQLHPPEGRVFPMVPNSLRVLDLRTRDQRLVTDVLFKAPTTTHVEGHGEDVLQPAPVFKELEFFRIHSGSYDAISVVDLLKPSMEAETLKTLHVAMVDSPGLETSHLEAMKLFAKAAVCGREDGGSRTNCNGDSNDHYNGSNNANRRNDDRSPALRPSSSLTSVGMSDFRYRNSLYTSEFTTKPFAEWVAMFGPGVHTVHVYPDPIDGCAEVLASLVKLPNIKTIYQDCLHGVLRDEVLAHAKKAGIEVIDSRKGFVPFKFPYPLEDPE